MTQQRLALMKHTRQQRLLQQQQIQSQVPNSENDMDDGTNERSYSLM